MFTDVIAVLLMASDCAARAAESEEDGKLSVCTLPSLNAASAVEMRSFRLPVPCRWYAVSC
jgi:hypothetical protein